MPASATADPDATSSRSLATAVALREQINNQQEMRTSRVREAKAEVDEKLKKAEEVAAAAAKKAAELARPKWVKPISNASLSAGFGEVSYLWSNRHTGQDFSAPYGTPIRAIGAGKIVAAGWEGAYGQRVVIEHKDGTFSWYAHLSSYTRRSGTVKAGEVIGRVGSTGNSTGPHLHLEIRPGNGDPIEPMRWLRKHGVDY